MTATLSDILLLKFIKFEKEEILQEAIELFKKSSIDLEDSYNLVFAREKGIDKIATFDRKLLKIFKSS